MKSERRHELQNNQLAEWLAEKYTGARQYITTVVACIVAAVAVYVVYSWLSNRSATQEAEMWNAYQKAISTDASADHKALKDFIRDHETGPAVLIARKQLAELQFDAGERQQLTDPDASIKSYQEAIDNYSLVREGTTDDTLRRVVTLKIAKAYESRYDLAGAKREYEALVKSWPDSAEGGEARERIEDLKRPEVIERYSWHRTAAKTTATSTSLPKLPDATLQPGKNLNELPDRPAKADSGAPESKAADDKSATDKKPEEPKAADKEAGDKKSDDKKADEKKPEEGKPVEKQPEAKKADDTKPLGENGADPKNKDAKPSGDAPSINPPTTEGDAKP